MACSSLEFCLLNMFYLINIGYQDSMIICYQKYFKRSMLAPSQKFIFLADTQSSDSEILHLCLCPDLSGFINLQPLIQKVPNKELESFEIYNGCINEYSKIEKDEFGSFKIPSNLAELPVLIFRLDLRRQKNLNQPVLVMDKKVKLRDRSRSIGEVLEFVKAWRILVEKGENGKTYNYQEAAERIGMPKKSLDDYYYHLRVGQKFDFQFEKYQNEKIKFLRNFVKEKVPERLSQHKQSQKLPKQLKILNNNPKEDVTKIEEVLPQPDQSLVRSRRRSESQVSSLPPIWMGQVDLGVNMNEDEDEQSFFKPFERKDRNFVLFQHLL